MTSLFKKSFLILFLCIAFNLASTAQQEATHVTNNGSYYNEATELKIKALFNNPKAIVVVFPTDETKKTMPSPLGMSNNGVNWYIFRQDRKPLPDGATFKILYSPEPTEKQFEYIVREFDIDKKGAYLDHPSLNNNPKQKLIGITTHNPTGVYFNSFIDFAYDEKKAKWFVYSTDQQSIPKDLGIYIMVTENAIAAPVPTATAPRPIMPVREMNIDQPVKPVSIVQTAYRDIDFDNWGFEQGLTGWKTEGAAFNNQPTYGDNVFTNRVLSQMEYRNNGIGGSYWKGMGFNIGYKGRFWIGTYENFKGGNGTTFGATQGDAPKGTLISPQFQVTKSYCYFLIGGGSYKNTLRVELQIKQPDSSWTTQMSRTSFRNNEMLYRDSFVLEKIKGQTARVRIVDNESGNWGHINVDDFRFTDTVIQRITLKDLATNQPYIVDEDYPVWGFADTHTHPAHDDGFGNKLIVGKANDPLSVTYATAACQAIHTTAGSPGLNTPFIGGADVHEEMEGWPNFIGYPKFNSKTHQQQHVEFLKRAWQGGLRMICALAVNNMFMPSIALGPGHNNLPFDDESVTQRQLNDIKSIVASQSSWMEIAYTPKDARRIILEGKCAVVLGVEVDNFGNFNIPSSNWDDNVGPANAKLVKLTPENSEQLITDKVNQYYGLGVRQVTPIHYLSGTFGGAAVFRGELALIQMRFNNDVHVKSGADKNIFFSLKQDFSFPMVLAGITPLPLGYEDLIIGLNPYSNMNTIRMTDHGNRLMNKLMDKGIMLDSEHMGFDTKDDLFVLAARRNYPIISSHTDPSGLSFGWVKGQAKFEGSPEDLVNNFGTTNIRNIANEFNLADTHYEKIKNSGGTVGVFMLPYNKKAYQGYLGAVPNDCAGSSKTFAQIYLYSVDKMEGRGIALASDRGMVEFIAPRFGPNAAYTLRDETYEGIKYNARKLQRLAQKNGVKYDRPMGSFHRSWYHDYKDDGHDGQEFDAWVAFAAIEANVATTSIPDSYYPGFPDRVRNYARGFRAVAESNLTPPSIFNGDIPWEQAAMYCLQRNVLPSGLQMYSRIDKNQKERLDKIYNTIAPAWATWKEKYGNNEPIRRYRTGNRDWDFNTDGMAHYGMMPDFLQDLQNIGVSKDALSPLFRSAEDYIRAWEKAVKNGAGSR